MSLNHGESVQVLARLLDTVDFATVIQIVDQIDNGRYEILPFITKVSTDDDMINPYTLTKCCRTKVLIMPNCTNLEDNVLMMLPNLESLTIKAGNPLTKDVFQHLSYITKLQILSHNDTDADTLLDFSAIKNLTKLEMLHVRNKNLRNEYFRLLPNLKVLILEGNDKVTPAILNFLPKMEICILNRELCKFISSTRNNAIIKKIGKLDRVRIHAIENC